MKRLKLYEADDKMIELIRDNYSILQGLGAFGITLGFGDKTVREVCQKQNVDCYTFLVVVNFIINGYIVTLSQGAQNHLEFFQFFYMQ